MILKLIDHTPNPEKLIAMAAKLCYSAVSIDELEDNQTEENVAKFLKGLMGSGHTSPIEHASFTFALEGCSRITEQQLTRHRLASYSVQSGRYVTRDNAKFVIPPAIENNKIAKEIYLQNIEINKLAYKAITSILEKDYLEQCMNESEAKKKAIEDARYIFPQSLETKIIFTMNLRTLINFLNLRRCKRAQWEIRELASMMIEELKPILPTMVNYMGASCETGKCSEGKMSCGNPYKK